MQYDYRLTVIIPAAAREIYDAWLDSLAHSEMTGGRANMSAELGAEFSAWDGYITGRNLELVPGERIVQSWRTTKFPEDHEDSTITVTLEESDDGTLLTLWHSNVPEGHLGYEQGGWQKSYFEPMIAYFSGEPSAGGQAEEVARSVPASEASTEKRPEPRAAKQPVRRARLKRPAAKKRAAAPKGRPKRASARKKAATPQARSKRAAARKKLVAKGIAVASKAQRKNAVARATPKGAVAKAKKAVVKARAKPAVRAKARAKRAGSARRKSAGGGRR